MTDGGGRPPNPDPDLELLRRARHGDDSAFEELMSRHSERFHALAFFLVGDAVETEDIVQESFLKAYERLESFKGRSSVKTWLAGILFNCASRYHRSKRRRRSAQRMCLSAGLRRTLDRGALGSPSDLKMDVMAMLQMLQPEHREIVVLREMDGMSYQEIAELLGVPVGTVESRMFRARQELKARLKAYQE